MKKTFKTLTIAATCMLPIASHADIKHIATGLTLSELKDFLENVREEGSGIMKSLQEKIRETKKVFEAIVCEKFEDLNGERYKIGEGDTEREKKNKKRAREIFDAEHRRADKPNGFVYLASPDADKARSDLINETLKNRDQLLVINVKYDKDGKLTSVETLHWNLLMERIEEYLQNLSHPFHSYIVGKLDPKETAERLNAFSKEVSANELEERKVLISQLKELEIKSVREITFASVLESDFFKNKLTDEQRKKAQIWLNNTNELEKAIEAYAEAYPYVQKTVKVENLALAEVKKCDWDAKTFTFEDGIDEECLEFSYLAHKPKGAISEEQVEIEACLKNLLPCKNGKEKVILLLLLDEITPPEYRLKWLWDKKDCTYDLRGNAFRIGKGKFLSHEIGHYLQAHLGLYQTFEDYQIKFAKQLLQLENKHTEEPVAIPEDIRNDIEFGNTPAFYGLKDLCFKCPKKLSAKKFFECFQLLKRWGSTSEISDILGVYFKGDTLYLNALSDIRELKRIRYTHNRRLSKKEIGSEKDNFKEETDKALFERIVEEAYRYPVPTKMLGLLCRLHQRKNPDEDAQNVMCDFDLDCSSAEEYSQKIESLISVLIKAEP